MRGVKKICCHIFFVATNFTTLKIVLLFYLSRKKFGPVFKEFKHFLPKSLSLTSQKYGFGIRDPDKNLPVVITFYVATNFTKLQIILVLKC
jgi:hypothetical protein